MKPTPHANWLDSTDQRSPYFSCGPPIPLRLLPAGFLLFGGLLYISIVLDGGLFDRPFLMAGGFFTALLGVGNHPWLHRWLPENQSSPPSPAPDHPEKNVLIVGAGEAGQMLLREINNHPGLRRNVIGFVDDDPDKQDRTLQPGSIPVLGKTGEVTHICQSKNVDEVIIAMPSADGEIIRSVTKQADRLNADLRIVPGIKEIIEGDVHWNQIRQVRPEDLLGRESVRINEDAIGDFLRDRVVFITGAAGSIGSHLVRETLRYPVRKVVGFDQNESGLYELEGSELSSRQQSRFHSELGDVRNRDQVRRLVDRFDPDIIFHAAALKHVPMMERHPSEAIKTNIAGTYNVFSAALENNVRHCVLVSTDKAVHPKNIMGLSKRVGEYLVGTFQEQSQDTRFAGVRFGNVLGSRGSVVPLFKRQIEKGGPVTVTDPEVVRYFMTPTEAVRLLLRAASFRREGTIYVLEMGDPIRILDLAHQLIALSGYEPGTEIPVKITGLRKGEKMEEELVSDDEQAVSTDHDEIRCIRAPSFEPDTMNTLQSLMESPPRELRGVRSRLKSIVE